MKKLEKRRVVALLCALVLLCAGIFAGRLSVLSGSAVLRAQEGRIPELPALEPVAAPEEPAQALLDLNTATAAELEELPGIGPALAGRIVAYRTENGPFDSLEELTAVDGIGQGTLAGLAGLLTVS